MSDRGAYRSASPGAPIAEGASQYDGFELNEAYSLLQQWRWPNGKPECPHCGHSQFWYLSARRRFKCKAPDCRKQFSITSGSLLHSAKCGVGKLIAAVSALHENPEASAAEIMRITGMSYRGAYFLAMRIKQTGGIA